jgi:hypothetical protein
MKSEGRVEEQTEDLNVLWTLLKVDDERCKQ